MPSPARATGEIEEIARKVIWMLFLRVVIVTVLLGATIVLNLKEARLWEDPVQRFLILVVIATYAVTIPMALLARRPRAARRLAVATVAVDLGLAASLVYATGTGESVFTFIFSLAIINSAIIGQRRGSLISAGAATLIFALLVILTRFDLLPSLTDSLAPLALPDVILTLFVNGAAFFLVAYLASYLAEAKVQADQTAAAHLEDLTRLEEIHRYIVETITSGLITTDSSGRAILVNPTSERLLGRSSREILGHRLDAILPQIRGLLEPDRQSFGPTGTRVRELTFTRPDGRAVRLEVVVAPLRSLEQDRPGLLVTFRDLTELRAMEAAVRRSERLAAIGELSAALAHEIRNPLASMSGSIQLLRGEMEISGDQRRLMDIVLREADRLEALIRDFLAFARPSPPSLEPVNLSRLVVETADLFRHDGRFKGKLELELDTEVELRAEVDARQITQVLLNLLANGAEAMNGGGQLTLALRDSGNGRAQITVDDQGPGLDPEEASRVFDPFFTTKEHGTGLGLSVVHRIVEAHRGQVLLGARPGGGCRAEVDLPLIGDKRAEAAS